MLVYHLRVYGTVATIRIGPQSPARYPVPVYRDVGGKKLKGQNCCRFGEEGPPAPTSAAHFPQGETVGTIDGSLKAYTRNQGNVVRQEDAPRNPELHSVRSALCCEDEGQNIEG